MIVATNKFDIDEVIKIVKSRGPLLEYVTGITPENYRHIDGIIHNTRYLLYLTILKSKKFTLDEKAWVTETLTKGLHVVGYMDVYINCQELERHINMDKVRKYYEGDKYGKGS